MTHSSGILVFVRTKHTGGSYEPLQTSYTIRARKAKAAPADLIYRVAADIYTVQAGGVRPIMYL